MTSRSLHATLLCFGLTTAVEALAQACTTCSPLSLPTQAATGVGAVVGSSGWVVSGQIEGGWLEYPRQTIDGAAFADPNRARVDVGLLSLSAAASHRSGVGFDLLLPGAVLSGADVVGQRLDPGLGDLELRGRFTGRPHARVTLTGGAGLVAPTGRYSARSGDLALGAGSVALTPGRGSTWALAEGDAYVSATSTLGVVSSIGARVPLGQAVDGFAWGPEARGYLGAAYALVPKRLSLTVGAELLWRGASSLVEPFTGTRVVSDNTGGLGVVAIPSASVQLPKGFFASMTMRINLWQRLAGLQFVPGVGVFVGVGLAVPIAQTARQTGRWVLRQYRADWCEACHTLEPKVAAFQARSDDVQVETLDVTRWTQEALDAAAPGAAALPIIDILRPDGVLAARLVGEAAQTFETRLKELMP